MKVMVIVKSSKDSEAGVLPPDFMSLKLTARRYAVFPHTNRVSEIAKAIETIWTKWVPDCGLKIAQSPCFERYSADFDPAKGKGVAEIWIPLD